MDKNFLLSLVAALMIVIIIPVSIKYSKKKHNKNNVDGENNMQMNGDNNSATVTNISTQNNYNSNFEQKASPKEHCENSPTADEIKARIKILFVDDKDDFPIIEMLKKIGYQVEYMHDIVDLDDKAVQFADIIFLDINGVGVAMKFKNQGMGLCGALRDHFGATKRLILYSGETEGSIFDKDAKKADATLPKDSDLYQFTSYITQYGKELLEKTNR